MDLLASCSDVVKIWDTSNGKLGKNVAAEMSNRVTNSCCWNSTGRRVITAGEDGLIALVGANGIPVHSSLFSAHDEPIRAITISPSSEMIAAGGDAGIVEVWQGKGHKVPTMKHGSPIMCVAFLNSDYRVAAGDKSGRVLLHRLKHDSTTEAPVSLPSIGGHSSVTNLAVKPGDPTLMGVTHSDGAVRFWETEKGYCNRDIEQKHGRAAMGIGFNPRDHCFVATAGSDGWVRYFDIRTREKESQSTKPTHTGVPLSCLSFHNEGRWVAVGASDGTIMLIDLRSSSKPMCSEIAYAGPSPPRGGVRDIAFRVTDSSCGRGSGLFNSSSSSGSGSICSSLAGVSCRDDITTIGSSAAHGVADVSTVQTSLKTRRARVVDADATFAARSERLEWRPFGSGEGGYGDYANEARVQPSRSRTSSVTIATPVAFGSDNGLNYVSASSRSSKSNSDTVFSAVAGKYAQVEKPAASSTARRVPEQGGKAGGNKDFRRRRGDEGGTRTRSQRTGRRESTGERFTGLSPERRLSRSPERHVVAPEDVVGCGRRGQDECRSGDGGISAGERVRWSPSRTDSSSCRQQQKQNHQHYWQQKYQQAVMNGYHEKVPLSTPKARHSEGGRIDRGLDHQQKTHKDTFTDGRIDQGLDHQQKVHDYGRLSPGHHHRDAGAAGHGSTAGRRKSPDSSTKNRTCNLSDQSPKARRSAKERADGAEGGEARQAPPAPGIETRATDAPTGALDRAMLEEVLSSHMSALREELRESIRNLNVDIRRQFHSLQEEQMVLMSNFEERLGVLLEENKTMRAEIARLRRAY